MFDAAVAGDLKAMYIFGEDVAQTDPDTAHVVRALESLEFCVCQDIFETETTNFADVILPASSFLEKRGRSPTRSAGFSSSSRRSTRPGEAKTDFEIIAEVSRALGHETGWDGPEDAMREIAALTPHFAGVTYERLGRKGLQWPVTPTAPTRRSSTSASSTCPAARRSSPPFRSRFPGDQVDDDFPLMLVTGRRLEHYNAGTMTRRTGNVELADRDHLEIHPDDAERLWIGDGDRVSLRSRMGRVEITAQVTEKIKAGHVFATFHFPETKTNLLVGSSSDVNTSCPEYKVIAVDVRPVAEEPSMSPALSGAGSP